MSQAESRNTTNLSRRRVLAARSIAAAPAVAAVDNAGAAGADAELLGRDAAKADAAVPLPPENIETDARNWSRKCAAKFADAYYEWLAALAAQAQHNASGLAYTPEQIAELDEDADAETDMVMDRVSNAARQLAVTPAILAYQLIQKFEVLSTIISTGEHDGYPTDKRHLILLASAIADLSQFQIKNRRSA